MAGTCVATWGLGPPPGACPSTRSPYATADSQTSMALGSKRSEYNSMSDFTFIVRPPLSPIRAFLLRSESAPPVALRLATAAALPAASPVRQTHLLPGIARFTTRFGDATI